MAWQDIKLSSGASRCEVGSLDDDRAELIRLGVHDSRTGRPTWMFRASLTPDQRESVRRFRTELARNARVRLEAQLPESLTPYQRLQLDGCRLVLDENELRLEDPDTANRQSWMWKPS